ncbi:MAG: type II toxin-antitoxin system death-on-curing family toxin [Candidatus Eremiobacteraeota bacterium]|nr:type II toxin-antitoxin system death-on-curing family toxin [Candidatus Eremiobacteraeota bacterium]
MPSKPKWIRLDVVLAVHEAVLDEHGGSLGVRDAASLESALAPPQHADAYAERPLDVPRLAAIYALAISRDHPFLDGNKRVALAVLESFLELNGYMLSAGDVECVRVIWALAAGELTDDEFIGWVGKMAVPKTRRRKK